jgi:hypothetical protein
MLLGTAIWAMKHWASHRGFIGLDFQRVDKMEQLTVFIAAASLVAAMMALWWLASSKSLSTQAAPHLHRIAIITGALTIVVLPLFTGLALRDPQAMDVTSLGTYALLLSLPWGVAFILSGYLIRPAALGALVTTASSIGFWTYVMLVEEPDLVGAGLGFVLLVGVWLIALQWRGDKTATARTPMHE